MKNAPNQYAPNNQTGDGAAGESGAPDRAKNVGTLTGINRDKAGTGENMATES